MFSLAIHRLLSHLKADFKVFYLNDGTLGGTPEEVVEDLRRIEDAADDLGLVLNHRKSEVICSDPTTKCYMLSVSPDFHHVDPAKACLLGSPIGDRESIDEVLEVKRSTLELLGERLSLLHSQDALCLLRNAFSLPKVLYVLRTAPCFQSPILLDLDQLQRSLLECICNIQLSNKAWKQASLPIKSGGLGIRSFAMLAPSAFLASAAGSSCISQKIPPISMQGLPNPPQVNTLALWSQSHHVEAPSGPDVHKQRAWDSPQVKAAFSVLLDAAIPRDKGRLLAVQRKESGAWLTAPPVTSLGLRLEDETVRIGVGLRLGVPICSTHKCTQCGDQVDVYGTHGLHCRKKPGVHSRHTALNDEIKRSLVAAEVPAILELVGLCRSDGKRPDGVTIIPWKRGRPLTWDVTCWDTFAPSYTSIAASGAGATANRAETRKLSLYSELSRTHYFIPIGLETLGAFGDEALSFLKELGHLMQVKSLETQSYHFLCQRISIIIQRFNSVAILSCSKV